MLSSCLHAFVSLFHIYLVLRDMCSSEGKKPDEISLKQGSNYDWRWPGDIPEL